MLRACAKWTMRVGVTAVILTAMASAAVAVRLASGPVEVARLAELVEEEVAQALPGWDLAVRDASLAWDVDAARLTVRLRGISLNSPAGLRAVKAEEARIGVDVAAAVLGSVKIRAAELLGARLLVTRTADGRIRAAVLNAEDAPAGTAADALTPEQIDPAAFDAVAALGAQFETLGAADAAGGGGGGGALDDFERLVLRSVSLRYIDEAAGEDWRLPNGELVVERAPQGLRAVVAGQLWTELTGAPTGLSLTIEHDEPAQRVSLSAAFENAPASAVASQAPSLAGLGVVEARVSGSAEASVALDGARLLAFSGAVATDGAIVSVAPGQAVAIDRVSVAFAYAPDRDQFQVDDMTIRRAGSEARLAGLVTLKRDAQGRAVGGDGALELRALRLEDPRLISAPLEARSGGLSFDFETGPLRLDVRQARIDLGRIALEASAGYRAGRDGDASVFAAEVDFTPFDVATLVDVWPLGAAAGGRRWVRENVDAGAISNARLRAAVDNVGARLDFLFDFDGLTARHIEGMTPISRARGAARLRLGSPLFAPEEAAGAPGPAAGDGGAEEGRFDLRIDAGVADMGPGLGAVELGGSSFAIPTFEPDIPPGEIEIRARSRLPAVLSLLDEEPLGYIAKVGLDPSKVLGDAVAQVSIGLPLARAVTFDEMDLAGSAELRSLSLISPQIGRLIRADIAEVDVDARRLRLRSQAKIDGYDAWFDWREIFSAPPGGARSAVNVVASVDAATLQSWGAPPELARSGAVGARVSAERFLEKPLEVSIALDLTDLEMAAEPLGWTKPRGVDAEARLRAEMRDEARVITELRADLGALRLRGDAELAPDGALRRLALSRFAVGEDTELKATIVRPEPAAPFAVAVSGPRLDLRGLLAEAAGRQRSAEAAATSDDLMFEQFADLAEEGVVDAAPAAAPKMLLDAIFDEIRLTDEASLGDVSLNGAFSPEDGARGVLTAFADGAPVLMEMAPTPQGQGFKLSSSAAGDALRGLNLFEDGHEGRMTLTGVVQDEGVIVGELFVEDLVVKNAPVVARILSIGTLIGLVDQLGSGGIVFSRIRAGFDVEDGVLVLRDAAASGPSLGFTLQGAVKLSDQTADLSGSVSPAYAVTGAISDVPVLRELLTGGAGEGLIGVSFGVSGPLADPSVSVNPLSAFAIGPLRRLFKRKSKFESARDAEERAERRRERGPLPLEPSLGNR